MSDGKIDEKLLTDLRKRQNESVISKLLSDQDENKMRKKKLKKIEDVQKNK